MSEEGRREGKMIRKQLTFRVENNAVRQKGDGLAQKLPFLVAKNQGTIRVA